jgi:small subunit ribosomal protein S25e
MGGKKRLTLKQMERMQAKKAEEERRRREKKAAAIREKKAPGVIPPDPRNEKIVDEIKSMPVLTPYTVASRFNIRISAAKDFLEHLEKNGVVQLVSGNHSIKIYKAV